MSSPTPPPNLPEIEAHVMASECPALVISDRPAMRALIAYVRALEAQAARLRARTRTTVFVEQRSL